ncbi:hypothetical protein ETAA8_04970 [Anatilimnocola aggregata]|uniref:Uncharacterized protein n=1 Tax=Anatilimnocola aggregata TaxID=2528021 RepID=A0A517Y5B2_9BACT|nr:hypothetical protein [Anatilimnocola aggregata]QDU25429.1 hypothetical protein ETAA8_04970 [Anatilimnocola aggregata]
MGSSPYWYFEKYNPDIDEALQTLRQREFLAGRYNPVILFPDYPVTANSPAPGAGHDSIDAAREDAAEDGTRSILDMDHVAEEPEFCAVSPLPGEHLEELYGTAQPTRAMVENEMSFLEDVDRGLGVYIILYRNGEPDEICFAGYSFD